MSSTDLLLGLDLGLSGAKAVLFDLDGGQVASAVAALPIDRPRPGCAERDLEQTWSTTAALVRSALADAPARSRVLAVGLSGHNDGLVALDAHQRLVRPAILATDSRAFAEAQWLRQGRRGEELLARTGQLSSPGSPPSLLRWLRRYEPDSYRAITTLLFCKDWLRFRLTGDLATDPSEASAAFVDVRTRRWSRPAAELYQLADLMPALPAIRDSEEVCGRVLPAAADATGLAVGTPVAVGAHDAAAAAIGAGATRRGSLSMVLGTFSINQVLFDRPVLDRRWQARSFVDPGWWLHIASSSAGAACLDWAVRRIGPFGSGGEPDIGRALAEAFAGPRVVPPMFLPSMRGSPHGAHSGGAWLGLEERHGRADLLYAVAEGVAFTHRAHVDALAEGFDLAGPVRIGGGGARSGHWRQLLADALARPLEVTDGVQVSSRGAVLLAGVGVGAYPDVASAVAHTVRVARVVEPVSARQEMLDCRYRRHRAARAALSGVD